MGTVYKARDTKLDRFVALKFLPPHLSQDEENKKRFIHEAKAASALNHPNIATIYEIDEAEGQTREVLHIAIQIAEGLQTAHAKGIIHRDVKPANILVTGDGVVKIVDFGLAKLAGRTMLTKEGTTLGTVAYVSPEQTQGTAVDHRTDIWTLGVILYEVLSGRHPFKGEYEQAVMYSILNEKPQPLTNLRSGIPLNMVKIVNRCLEKQSARRYQSVSELLDDLTSATRDMGWFPSTKSTRLAPAKASVLW